MASTVDVLRAARNLYELSPSHAGADDYPNEGEFCPIYAILSAAAGVSDTQVNAELALRCAVGFDGGLVRWNAEHSTEEVLAAFDRAIEAESA